MNFSEALRAARESALLTQEGAAAVIGIAKRTYCDWEAGNVVPHRYMQDGALRDLRGGEAKVRKINQTSRRCMKRLVPKL